MKAFRRNPGSFQLVPAAHRTLVNGVAADPNHRINEEICMLKKTLLALSVAWTGTAAAASNSLDDVTMNIVNETAFEEIITASPAEIEKLLQENGNAKPVRTITLRNLDASTFTAGTPIEGQVFTVSKELNQGMVSFSFICS